VGNVWDAMRRHQAEQAASEAQSPVVPEEGGETPASPEQQNVATAIEDRPATPSARRADRTRARQSAHGTRNGRYSELLLAYNQPGDPITEDYRAVRISLLAQAGDRKLCCLVTSSNPGEGKTVTCANLAVVLAEREERRTILVDCDLRKASLAKLLNANKTPGVVEILRGAASPAEAIQSTAFPNLFFMPAGQASSQEVGEMLGRPELEDLFHQLRRDYDYVLIDTPPINKTPDAGMIGRFAKQAIIVVRMNKTRRESVEKAKRSLHAAQVEVNGIILTARKYHIPKYLYHYS